MPQSSKRSQSASQPKPAKSDVPVADDRSPVGTEARAEAEPPPNERPSSRSLLSDRARLVIAVAGAVIWLGVLVVLAALTANPVVLNRDQVLQADFVVHGKLEDPETGLVDVEEIWPPDVQAQEITIEGLGGLGAQAGREYIIPVSESAEATFVVTRPRHSVLVDVGIDGVVPFEAVVLFGNARVVLPEALPGAEPTTVTGGEILPAQSRVIEGQIRIAKLGKRRIYLATADTLSQLERILGDNGE